MGNDELKRLVVRSYQAIFVVLTIVVQGCTAGESSVNQDLRNMAQQAGIQIAAVSNRRLEIVNYERGQPDYVMEFGPLIGPTRASPDGRYVGGILNNYEVGATTGRDKVVVIDTHGTVVWQAPGVWSWCVALSSDVQKAAFQGDAGLFYALRQSAEASVKLWPAEAARTPEERGCSLAWSPDADRITYASGGKVLIYDFRSSKSTVFADGTYPTWSPDGNWIAFRRPDGTAVVRSPDTGMEKIVAGGDKILGSLRWSPDSGYLLYRVRSYRFTNVWAAVTTLSGSWTSRLRVYRLRDGASTTIVPALPSNSGEHFGWLKTR